MSLSLAILAGGNMMSIGHAVMHLMGAVQKTLKFFLRLSLIADKVFALSL